MNEISSNDTLSNETNIAIAGMRGYVQANSVIHGDCLEVMRDIQDGSIDMILCDLPYGTTACTWDAVIPFDKLWKQYERIIKDNGAIVLTGNQPFTSNAVLSNSKLFKYELIWEKSKPTGFLDAKSKPLRCHENILVFYKKPPTYNPQIWKVDEIFIDRRKTFNGNVNTNTTYGNHEKLPKKKDTGDRLPISVIPAKSFWSKDMHPTQKPVSLFEYLINTYTNVGDLVLDNCAGSGTTGEACLNTGRNYVLIEKEEKYINVIEKRISNVKRKLSERLF